MKRETLFRKAFPTDWTRLQDARKQDPVLDEICSDFEQLSVDLECARIDCKPMSAGLKNDVTTAIEALKREIIGRLPAPSEDQTS